MAGLVSVRYREKTGGMEVAGGRLFVGSAYALETNFPAGVTIAIFASGGKFEEDEPLVAATATAADGSAEIDLRAAALRPYFIASPQFAPAVFAWYAISSESKVLARGAVTIHYAPVTFEADGTPVSMRGERGEKGDKGDKGDPGPVPSPWYVYNETDGKWHTLTCRNVQGVGKNVLYVGDEKFDGIRAWTFEEMADGKSVGKQLAEVKERLGEHEERLGEHEERLDGIDDALADHEERLGDIERWRGELDYGERIDNLEEAVRALQDKCLECPGGGGGSASYFPGGNLRVFTHGSPVANGEPETAAYLQGDSPLQMDPFATLSQTEMQLLDAQGDTGIVADVILRRSQFKTEYQTDRTYTFRVSCNGVEVHSETVGAYDPPGEMRFLVAFGSGGQFAHFLAKSGSTYSAPKFTVAWTHDNPTSAATGGIDLQMVVRLYRATV